MRSNGSNPIECATYWNIPSFCGVQVELEQVTQAVLSGEQDSYFLWNNPWNDKLSSGTYLFIIPYFAVVLTSLFFLIGEP